MLAGSTGLADFVLYPLRRAPSELVRASSLHEPPRSGYRRFESVEDSNKKDPSEDESLLLAGRSGRYMELPYATKHT